MPDSLDADCDANYRDRALALFGRSRMSRFLYARSLLLLPRHVHLCEYRKLKALFGSRPTEGEFVARFDRIFYISLWEALNAEVYAVFIAPFIATWRTLCRGWAA